MASKTPKPPRPSRPPPTRAVPARSADATSPTKPVAIVPGGQTSTESQQLSRSSEDSARSDCSVRNGHSTSAAPVPRQRLSTISGSRPPTTAHHSTVAGTTKPSKPTQRPPSVYNQPPWENTAARGVPSRIPQSTARSEVPNKTAAPRPSVRSSVSPTSPPVSSPPIRPSPPSKPQPHNATATPDTTVTRQPTPATRSIRPFSSKRSKPVNPYIKTVGQPANAVSPSPRSTRKSSHIPRQETEAPLAVQSSSIPLPSSPIIHHTQSPYVNVRAPPPRKMNASVTPSSSQRQVAPAVVQLQSSVAKTSTSLPEGNEVSTGTARSPTPSPPRAATASPAPGLVARVATDQTGASVSPTPQRRSHASPVQPPVVARKLSAPDTPPKAASRGSTPSADSATHRSNVVSPLASDNNAPARPTTASPSTPRYNITRPAPAAPAGGPMTRKGLPATPAPPSSAPPPPQRVAPTPPAVASPEPHNGGTALSPTASVQAHSNTSQLAEHDAPQANTAGTAGNGGYDSHSDSDSLGSEDQWSPSDSDEDEAEEQWKQQVLLKLHSGRTSVISTSSRGSMEVEVDTSSHSMETVEAESDRKTTKQLQVVQEIVKTEQTYVYGLKLLQELFVKELCEGNKPVLSPQLQEEIFMNSTNLLAVHTGIVQQLENVLAGYSAQAGTIGDVFSSIAPYLKIYKHYAANFDRAMSRVEELSKKNPAFISKLQKCHADSRVGFGLTLGAYLLEPIQRIPRYKLLLQEHLKNLPEGHPDVPMTEEALIRIADVATDVNEGIRARENADKVKELQGDFPKAFNIVKPGRFLKMQGQLGKVCRRGTQPRNFFLFSDGLVYAQNEGGKYITPRMLPLEGMRVAELEGEVVGEKYCFELKSSKKSFIIGCPSVSEKLAWQKELKDTIAAYEKALGHGAGAAGGDTDGVSASTTGGVGTEAPMWIPDSGVSMCQLCTADFTVLKRRHHCRLCGKVVCGVCSGNNLPIPYKNNKAERVCDECFDKNAADDTAQTGQAGRSISRRVKPRKSLRQVRGVLEISAHGIKGDEEILLSGYLAHNKSAFRKTSKRSWFVLKRDFVLYKFRAPEDVLAMTSLPLPGNQVSAVDTDRRGSMAGGVLVIEHPSTKPMYLEADSKEQRDTWVKLLSAASRLEIIQKEGGEGARPEGASDPTSAADPELLLEASEGTGDQSDLLERIDEIDADENSD